MLKKFRHLLLEIWSWVCCITTLISYMWLITGEMLCTMLYYTDCLLKSYLEYMPIEEKLRGKKPEGSNNNNTIKIISSFFILPRDKWCEANSFQVINILSRYFKFLNFYLSHIILYIHLLWTECISLKIHPLEPWFPNVPDLQTELWKRRLRLNKSGVLIQ